MDKALKYTFIGIATVGALVVNTMVVASMTYFLTKNYYRNHNPGQAQTRTVQTATLGSLGRYDYDLTNKLRNLEDENAVLTARLIATQESLATSRRNLESSTQTANGNGGDTTSPSQTIKNMMEGGTIDFGKIK